MSAGHLSRQFRFAHGESHPSATDDERRTIAGMMAKVTYAGIVAATRDLDATSERVEESHAEVVQEPTEQPAGVRGGASRDPAGNRVRIQELRQEVWPSLER